MMKLIARKDIQWDIVKKNRVRPWVLLGWPLMVVYSKWGVGKDHPIVIKSHDVGGGREYLRFRLPWGPKDTDLRACLYVYWLGLGWFWRES